MKNITNFLLSICTFMICACQVLPPAALLPISDENQLAWHKHEQYAFIHESQVMIFCFITMLCCSSFGNPAIFM
jgi:hypothetical protein